MPFSQPNNLNNLLTQELDAIESDKEGEDIIQSSLNKHNFKKNLPGLNDELFENNDLFGYGKYEETKENLRY
jgi:hypothetical protein